MKKVWKLFSLAAKEATKNKDRRHYKFGCLAVRNDGAIVASCNGPTPAPARERHAEYRVSKKLDYNAIVYVARVLNNGYGRALPCTSCLKALKAKRVRTVYFTIDDYTYGVLHLSK